MYAYISKDYVTVVSGKVSGGGDTQTPSSSEGITYSVHAQTYGWMGDKQDGAMAGTEGEAKRLEAVKIKLRDPSVSGSVKYRSHIQSIGWDGLEVRRRYVRDRRPGKADGSNPDSADRKDGRKI